MIAPALIESALRAWRPATVLRPGDALHSVAVSLYRALVEALPAALRPVTGVVLGTLEDASQRVSVTLATPGDPVIVLSPAAVADEVSHACTLAHEWVHVGQIARVGRVQTAVDYLGSGELRAQREADAAAVGLWLRYVMTGELPAEAPTLGDLYHLSTDDAALARAVIASHLDTIRAGALPPLDVCVVLAQWLHATPREIPADVLARVPRVPS